MKKSTAALALLLCVTLVAGSHVETQVIDGETIFLVDSVPVDLRGYWREKSTDWINFAKNRCDAIAYLTPDSADYQNAQQAVQLYSPPDSNSAKVVQLAGDGEWFWAEITFDKLEPVVLILRRTPNGLQIWNGAVWSGPTHPWRVKSTIEKYLKAKSPAPSHRLLTCMHPSAGVFVNP